MVNELGLIQILVQCLHDLIPYFHPYADIHRTRCRFNTDLFTFVFEPVRSFPADCGDDLSGMPYIAFVCLHTSSNTIF